VSGVLPAITARLAFALAGVTIAEARAPDSPDELVLVREYPSGSPRDLDANARAALEHHGVQVLARAVSVAAAEALAWRAYRALPGRHLDLAGVRFDWITANHAPHHLGFDQNDRALVVCNFTLQRWGDLGYAIARAATGVTTATGGTPVVTGGTT
jgi:hypothetical protein